MIRKINCFLFLMLLAGTLRAQESTTSGSYLLSAAENLETGIIKGHVQTSDGRDAANVSIGLKGRVGGTQTNRKGEFTLKTKPGTYTLRASAIGMQAQEKTVTVSNGQTVIVNFTLSISAEQLQEVIVSANRNNYKTDNPSASLRLSEPLIEIPQNVQVVTPANLADQQIISMSDDLIRNVSGAVRMKHWGDLYANIIMRGSQIQAFRNGFNVVNSYWGPLTEDMSFVDHIEFVKGPAGFMLANGDPSGLYNVVTKKPTGETKGEATFTLGSYDLYRTTLDLDGKLNNNGRLLYRLNLAGQNKKSHRADEYNNRYSIAPVISYQFDDRTKLTAEYTLQHAKMSNVGSFYVFSKKGYADLPVDFTTIAPGLEPTIINDHSLFLNLQHTLNDNWKLTTQAGYFNYQQKGSDMWPQAFDTSGKMIRGATVWDAKSEMTLAQVFLNGNITTGAVRHRILSGLDIGTKNYMADWGQTHPLDTAGGEFDIYNPYYTAPNNGYPSFDRSLNLEARAQNVGGLIDLRYTGFYVQDELGFFENKLRLTLAGRYTFVSQSSYGGPRQTAKHITPRLGLSVSLDDYTSVYALYDQAFLPQSGVLANGGKVRPITGNNMEIGIKKDWFSGQWNTTLSAYRILKENELTGDPNSPPNSGLSIVLGQKRAQGIEFDLRGEIARGLNMMANYAYTDYRITKVADGITDIQVGDLMPSFAKHTLNSWLSYQVPAGVLKGSGVSAGFTYLIDRSSDELGEFGRSLPDYFKLDGGLFWSKDKIKLTANVFNILDEYLYSGGYYGWGIDAYYWQTESPRNFRLSVSYKF